MSEQPRPLSLRNRILARLATTLVRALCSTVRLTIERDQESVELLREYGGGLIVTWHGRTLIPIDRLRGLGHHGYHMLVSLSRDGDFLSAYCAAWGLKVIRGSTKRRGAGAAREVLSLLRSGGVLAFTPDGPRGPAQVAQTGVVYFAQKSGKPIIPAGIAAWPCWHARSWDRFMVPYPLARAHWIYGEPLYVRPEENLEEAAARVSAAINALQARAEVAVRAPAPRNAHRQSPASEREEASDSRTESVR